VNHIVTDCIESLQPIADQKKIQLSFVAAPEGTEVFCDTEAVYHALSNLLDNAIKYTPDGGKIIVSARVLDQETEGESAFVEIAVQDSGQGIPEQDLSRLFERFYRVDKARSRELGGTGLGLAIVKHLVLALGGTVRVENVPDGGALFAFTVPVEDMGLSEEREVKSELTIS
jgi:two-component system phosphate regulon sensor histidine kinase PhoR